MTLVHPDVAAPKAAVRALIDACGGAGAVCSLLGLSSRSLVDRWANPNEPDKHAPLGAVWRMESFCGRAIVSEAGVRRVSDHPARRRRRACISDLTTWIAEGCEAKVAYAALFAKPGERPSSADRAKAIKEIRELELLLADLREAVEEGE